MNRDLIYDIETFPNCFTCSIKHAGTGQAWVFEISDRRDDYDALVSFISTAAKNGCRMVGFNSIGFDYPVIHYMLMNRCTVADIYDKAMSIINTPFNARFSNVVWESEWKVEQIDLYKVMHFDNIAKATGLKVLEFNMRMESVEDLPFPVGTTLTSDQIDTLIEYNMHDVDATLQFYNEIESAIKLRESLTEKFDRNMMNMSDVKIGETLLTTAMEQHDTSCYAIIDGRRQKKQTIRESLNLGELIFPYVNLENPEFNRIKQWLADQTITETKGVFTDLTASLGGLDYNFGTGGLHASLHCQIVYSDDYRQLVDVDVASFYPNLGIRNKLYPAHLGTAFCDAYLDVYNTRKTFPKKTPENEAYKLALNGAYGGSNNKYSPFFDTAYTMSITINGQLLLCMLIEQMLKVPGLQMVQVNTDGITYLCPREYLEHTRNVCRWWESVTNLELEEALYKSMHIRDVNSYIAVYENGNVKRIGAYAYVTAHDNPGTRELPWHKDWSARVVAMAAEASLVRGVPVREFIEGHNDMFDFMLRTKVPRNSLLEWGRTRVPNIIRYYISTDGDILEKVMPPKGVPGEYKKKNGVNDWAYDQADNSVWNPDIHTGNKSVHEERRSGIHTGWTIRLCNVMPAGELDDINYEYYIREAEKLVEPLI